MKRRILSAVLCVALLAGLLALPAAAYNDTEGHWAQATIDKWTQYQVIQGDQNGNFNPNGQVTVAEAAQMLSKTLNLTEKAQNPYTDLKGDEWYADAILKCAAAGILDPAAGTCNATEPASRETAAVMLAKGFGYAPAEHPDLSAFPDAAGISENSAGYLAALVADGVLTGTGDGSLAPGAPIDRASTLALLDRAATKTGKLPGAGTEPAQDPKPLILQGAMELETSTMAGALDAMQEVKIGGWSYFTGLLDGYPVVVSRTQVGVTNASAATALAIERFDPVAIINQGTAGGHDPDLHTHDIVLGIKAINLSGYKSEYSAEGAGIDTAKWDPLGMEVYDSTKNAWGDTVTTAWTPDEALLAAARSVADAYTAGKVVEGTIGSGDAWNNEVDRILQCHELFGTSCEEMETASVAQLCDTYDIPFLGLRILSNTGLYKDETFNPATGPECQNYTLDVARAYIATLPKAEGAKVALPKAVTPAGGKPIILQGAMDIETSTMAAALTDMEEISIGPWDYYVGKLYNYPVVVSRTEQGMANAAVATAFAIEYFNPVAVINQGTSGGHDPDLHTMDIVLGENVINMSRYKSDYAAKGAGIDTANWKLTAPEIYDAAKGVWADTDSAVLAPDKALLAAAEKVMETYTEGKVVKGTIGTGDIWNNQVDRILQCHTLYGTSVEEMETASAAQVCASYGVPFLGVRILSNTGLYKDETFNPASGPACQSFVLNVVSAYVTAINK